MSPTHLIRHPNIRHPTADLRSAVTTMTVRHAGRRGTDTTRRTTPRPPVKFTGLAALQATITPTTNIPVEARPGAADDPQRRAGPGRANHCLRLRVRRRRQVRKTPSCQHHRLAARRRSAVEIDCWWAPRRGLDHGDPDRQGACRGASLIGLDPLSTASDPRCPNDTCETATARITAVPAQPAPTPPQLAATGTTRWPLTWLGFALLTAGAILTYHGRRRGQRT